MEDNLSDDYMEESIPKRAKKHKHKKSKDKMKKEQLYYPTTDDGELINDGLLDYSATAEEVLDIDNLSGDETRSKMDVDKKNKKSKKKEKVKDKTDVSKNKKDKSKKVEDVDGKKEASANKDDGTDSEEERWLHAIEAGKLDEVDDELKRMRNPRLLTARQRALLEKQRPATDGDDCDVGENQMDGFSSGADGIIIPAEPLMALPSGFKEKVVTQEMLEKKAIKSQKRRAQALEKREEDKKKTVDRLLKKQDSKVSKPNGSKRFVRTDVAMISYRSNQDGATLSIPSGYEYPIQPQEPVKPPVPKLCEAQGCSNLKKYSCRQTGVALCSLKCYKTIARVT